MFVVINEKKTLKVQIYYLCCVWHRQHVAA